MAASLSPTTDRKITATLGSRLASLGLEIEHRLRCLGCLALRALLFAVSFFLFTIYRKPVAQAIVSEIEVVGQVVNLLDIVATAGSLPPGCVRGGALSASRSITFE
ncbi:hypothetical protein V5E97_33125 [Singulisphaera sp. Ch08]|uniref:Uncharacterized protein n=1 Tax=Singulisphaera sp. Ch08 TaxID=3120278 RepID=A0AAU7CCG5_9BACT